MDERDVEQLFAAAHRHAERLQDAAQARWQIGLGHAATTAMDWYFDHERRTPTFSQAGVPRVVADVRMTGSFSRKTSSFLWAWAKYDDDDPFVRDLARLPVFGEVRGLEALTLEHRTCDLTYAWELSSLAAYLVGGEALYRMPFEHLYCFLVLGSLRAVA